jgi:hypothetical protein
MRRNRTVKIVVCVLVLVMAAAPHSGCGAKKNTTITPMDGTISETRIGEDRQATHLNAYGPYGGNSRRYGHSARVYSAQER